MLRLLTAGESHGEALLAILEGMPCGLKVNQGQINRELARRKLGYGRGKRMRIEKDRVKILSGLKGSVTIGSPLGLLIENKEFRIDQLPRVSAPRPGHADLAGFLKYGFQEIRPVLERASARETAARVSIGAVCKIFLAEFGVRINSRIVSIGAEKDISLMQRKIRQAKAKGDTLGGIFEIVAQGVVPGLGSYVQWDRRLDAKLAAVMMSIPGIKAVEFGLGFGYAGCFGSEVHDPIYYQKGKGFFRRGNNAGGLEGGMTNGEPLVIRACMKPIATLTRPLASVDIKTKKPHLAAVERSDVCAVEAAAVIAENALAFVLADAWLEKFGSDSLADIKQSFQAYRKRIS